MPMPVSFTIHGPFEVPTKPKKIKGGKITIRQLGDVGASLWKEKFFSRYADKKGCYVFANAVTRGSTPIYVGRTNKCFKQECFATAKKAILNDFLAGATKNRLASLFCSVEQSKRLLRRNWPLRNPAYPKMQKSEWKPIEHQKTRREIYHQKFPWWYK